LDKSLAATSAKAIPSADQSASDSVPTPATGTAATQLTGMDKVDPPTQPTASTKGQQLAGMDKVDYTALIELAQQAQGSTDLPQQTKLLQQFMGFSKYRNNGSLPHPHTHE
jgi:hypothetical protein